MTLNRFFVPAPKFRPQLNIGCLSDVPNGRYYIGEHGESILNGGLAYFTGISGAGNTYKSTILDFMLLTVLNRYASSHGQDYDTEMSKTIQRLTQLAQTMDNIKDQDLEGQGRLSIVDSTSMIGNVWFKAVHDYAKDKVKNVKENMLTTPFIDKDTNKHFTAFNPDVFGLDSISMFTTDSVGQIYEKTEIGDSKANTDAMRGGAAKSQMLMQIPTLTAAHGLYIIATAHVGEKIEMDPYAPTAKKLQFLKGNRAFKHVPEKFTFLTNNLYYVFKTDNLQNKGTKAAEYPRSGEDDLKGDTDLQIATIQNLRAKNGPTGYPYDIILSQRDGVLASLSEFHYCKNFDRFGLGGNDRNYYLELMPDVSLSRTTVRGKLNEDAKLRRAMEITSELCQFKHLGYQTDAMPNDLPGETQVRSHEYLCEPKELYSDLKAKGYDWDRLLDTRGYWVFEEESTNAKPFLSTLDLLKMRADSYHPWWYGDLKKK